MGETTRCEQLEAQYAAAVATYQAEVIDWERRDQAHRQSFQSRLAEHAQNILTDPDYMTLAIERQLLESDWPRETQVAIDVRAKGKYVVCDVDLPEIEDLPSERAYLSKTGRKVNFKSINKTDLLRMYVICVFRTVFSIAERVLSTSPSTEHVCVSGFTQFLDSLGQGQEHYILSTVIPRSALASFASRGTTDTDSIIQFVMDQQTRVRVNSRGFKSVEPLD